MSASPATGEQDSGRDQNLRLNEAGATARAELGAWTGATLHGGLTPAGEGGDGGGGVGGVG